jgi:hypothetical protein
MPVLQTGLRSKLFCEVLSRKGPVYDLPESFHIFCPGIAVINIISMFPYITGQQRLLIILERIARIAGGLNSQAAVIILDQPGPAGAEQRNSRGSKFFFKLGNTAEILNNRFFQIAGRFPAAAGRQAVPVKGVVPDLAALL